jgi:hypothetical protein
MGTVTLNNPTSVPDGFELSNAYFPPEGTEYEFSGHLVKCGKCDKIYNFINRCANCSNSTFISTGYGQASPSFECAKCGDHYESWICGSCNWQNYIKKTFFKAQSTKSCFIATAVYGNYNAPEVIILRQFRDNYLVKKLVTSMLVSLYYRFSPPMANYVSKHNKIKCTTRQLLDFFVASKYVKKNE